MAFISRNNISLGFIKFTIGVALLALTACHRTPDTADTAATESAYRLPVVHPLIFSNARKLNWAKATVTPYSPTVAAINIDKLPAKSYADTAGFKPFAHKVDTIKFADYSQLPHKNFDVDQLPAKPLQFKTTILPKPKFMKAGPPRPALNAAVAISALTDAQGLDGQLVTAVYTDHYGYVWIATDKGIYRYDGENLLKYIAEPMPVTFAIAEDKTGRIWMGSLRNGLAMFDPKTGEYNTFAKKMLGTDSIMRIIPDKNNRLWIGSTKGISIINPDTKTFSQLKNTGILSKQSFTDMALDNEQRMWVSYSHGFDIIDLRNNKVTFLDNIVIYDISFDNLFRDSKDNIWMASVIHGTMSEMDIRHHQMYVLHDIPSRSNAVTGLTEDIKGRIWLSGGTDVHIVDMARQSSKDVNILMKDNYVNNIIIQTTSDKLGNTWLTTTVGLFVYKQSNVVTDHIGTQNVATVADDGRGFVYIGSNNGLTVVDPKQHTTRLLTKENGLPNDTVQNVILLPDARMNINTNKGISYIDSARKHIQTFVIPRAYVNVIDSKGKIWMGCLDGLRVYDPEKRSFTFLGKENGIGAINDLFIDKYGNLWMLSGDGTYSVIDPKRMSIKKLDFHLPPQLNYTEVILHDTEGNVWLGTPKGVYIINSEEKNYAQLSVPQGLVDEGVISLLKHNGIVYAGTNKGVSAITPPSPGNNNWKIISYGRQYGLDKLNTGYWMTDNMTHDGQYIWGDKGLTILNIAGNLRHVEPNVYITNLNLMDGPAYFTEPVLGHNDSTLQYNTTGKVLGPYNLPTGLELPYNKDNVQFNFGSYSTFKSDTTWYRYMLTGADKTWRNKTNETVTGNYFNLPPGQYIFKVSAMANDGTWSKPAIFNFTVLPPWWQTWWARLLMLLVLAGLIRLVVDIRSRSLLHAKRQLEQSVAERTKEVLEQKEELAAQRDSLEQTLSELKQTQSQLIQSEKMASLGELTAGIAHEIQNPLNFVNNFAEVNTELIDELQLEIEAGNLDEVKAIATDIQENEKKISQHGKRADAIVKGMLQHSRAGSGQKEPTDVNKLADEYLRLSYHGLRAKDKSFNAEMITRFDDNLPAVNILPQEVGRVLLNLFNNAFYAVTQKKKTAGAGYKPTVEITTFAPPSGGWGARIKDNGIGIPDEVKDKIMQPFFTTKPTGEGTGLGLSLSYDIVVKGHGGKLDIETKEGEYTQFTITLPAS